MATSSLQDRMTKCHRPPAEPPSMASCKSSAMILTCTPSMTPTTNHQTACPPQMWTNYSQSETPKCRWPPSQSQTSLDRCELQCCMNHTQACHPRISTTTHACLSPKSWKNLGSYQETTGIVTSKAWCRNIRTPSPDWEKGWWRHRSTGMTSSLTTLNSSCQEDMAAQATHAHSGQERTHIHAKSSQVRRPTPSSLGRHSPQWLTSLSNKKGMRPYMPKYSTHNRVGDLAKDLANLQKLYNKTQWEEHNSLCTLARANAFRHLEPRILHNAPTTLDIPWAVLNASLDNFTNR
jgi:hypothetical protein